jgi:protein-tyrosine phosphatase
VAACALVQGGMSPHDAIATVRAVRHPTAVETAEQERFVATFASAAQAGERA